MTENLSRRSVAQGIAWSVPAVAVAASAPAMAASPTCTAESKTIIDQAFADATAALSCNGAPLKLEINFYQPLNAGDGFATDAYVNIKNLSRCTYTFTTTNPLKVAIDVVRVNELSVTNVRDITGVRTSWGSRTWSQTERGSSPVPVGGRDAKIQWTFSGKLPGAGLGDNEADIAIGFGDGATGRGRIHDALLVTPSTGSGAPTFESLLEKGVSADCIDYYNEKLSTWTSPVVWSYTGPKGSGQLAAGATLDSRTSGNTTSGIQYANSTNGIW